jgi:hypothetical protein
MSLPALRRNRCKRLGVVERSYRCSTASLLDERFGLRRFRNASGTKDTPQRTSLRVTPGIRTKRANHNLSNRYCNMSLNVLAQLLPDLRISKCSNPSHQFGLLSQKIGPNFCAVPVSRDESERYTAKNKSPLNDRH